MHRYIETRSPHATIPGRATSGSAGFDCTLPINLKLYPGHSQLVNLAIGLIKPIPGMYFELHPRSSMRVKYGLTTHGTGIIDGDYLGDIKILLHNTSGFYVDLPQGTRIAQLIPRQMVDMKDTPLDATRGTGGFGSTGN